MIKSIISGIKDVLLVTERLEQQEKIISESIEMIEALDEKLDEQSLKIAGLEASIDVITRLVGIDLESRPKKKQPKPKKKGRKPKP